MIRVPEHVKSSFSPKETDSTLLKILKKLPPAQLAAVLHEAYMNNENYKETLTKAAVPVIRTTGMAIVAHDLAKGIPRLVRGYHRGLFDERTLHRADDSFLDPSIDLTHDLPEQWIQPVRDRNAVLVDDTSYNQRQIRPVTASRIRSLTKIKGPRVVPNMLPPISEKWVNPKKVIFRDDTE